MMQPVHKTDGRCMVEKNPPAKGGPSLGSVMPKRDRPGAPKGEKHVEKMPIPMNAGGGRTEQPQ